MTPNLKYINQSAPFWDWIASFEQSAADHPFFGGNSAPGSHQQPTSGDERGPPAGAAWGPWAAGGPWGRPRHDWHGAMPHHGGPPPHHHGGPENNEQQSGDETMREGEGEKEQVPDPSEETPGHPGHEGAHHGRRGRHGRCGGGRGSGFGFGGPSPHHHHPYGGRGGWGGMHGRGGFRMLSELFGGAAGADARNGNADTQDWKPEADVFDTETAFVVHISLPGAHKQDIGVAWDAEKSELLVSGVVHRPGDEAFLKTLALDERTVGAFERKVRLGTRAVPAHVDVEGITAKLDNGILIVDVPKLNGEYVEVKKVDIE